MKKSKTNIKQLKTKTIEKRKTRKLKKSVLLTIIISIIIIIFILLFIFITNLKPQNINIKITEDNHLQISFDKPKFKDIYCLISYDIKTPNLNNEKWEISKNNSCTFELNETTFYAYLKYNNKIIKIDDSKKIGKITNLEINQDKLYLAVDDTFKLELSYEIVGSINKDITWSSSNNEIATVDKDGIITSLKAGNAIITAKINNEEIKSNVTVTKLITKRPKSFNYNRNFLSCNVYNQEENDLLEEILKARVNDAGYQTRAGVVEAARFLTLEFPYKINYFSENGRMGFREYKVDGEGRYYHEGLYLHESRFGDIKYISQGPKTWGCEMYNTVTNRYSRNGLDCSGYISWVLYNGGFDPGDVGAGLTENLFDLTDTGKRVRFTKDLISNGEIKIGDLLSSEGPEGGHIALIMGEDDDYYYVTESLWYGPHSGVTVIAYNKNTIMNRYYWVMLMDSYYKEDGKYTNHWNKS